MTGRFIPETAPAALRNLPAWLCWRWMENPGSKPRKVPYYADGRLRTGGHGRPEDTAALVTFDQARQAALDRGMDGVGFATLRQFNITAMDFDACVNGGQVHPEVAALVAPTYAEISPSGTGVRAFFVGQFPRNRKSNAHAERFGAESFSHKGFVTFTGQDLFCGDTVAAITADLEAFVQRRFGADVLEAKPPRNPIGLTQSQIAEILAALDPPVEYEQWLQIGMSLHHETRGAAWALEAWDRYSQTAPAAYGGPDVLAAKWDSFGRGDGSAVTGRTLLRLAREAGVNVHVPKATAQAFANLDQLKRTGKFAFQCMDEFMAAPPAAYLVKGVLQCQSFGVMYGAPGSGKSFAALDLVCAVLTGQPWNGKRVRPGRVAYIAAEGANGFRKRLKAKALTGTAADNLILLAKRPNFLENDAAEVAAEILAAGGADLIVIDTLSQVIPGGNENGPEDMTAFVSSAQALAEATGATVLTVHHSGKDATKGSRGHSSLKGAADFEMEVTRTGDFRTLTVTKSKDDIDGAAYAFQLRQVVLGMDEDGDPITSCVVQWTGAPVAPAKAHPYGKWETAVLAEVRMAFKDLDHVSKDAVLDAVVRADGDWTGTGKDRRRERAKRALDALQAQGNPWFRLEGETVRQPVEPPIQGGAF